MYATLRELEERQILSFTNPVTNGENEVKNPLDLLDQEKLLSDLSTKNILFQGRIHEK